MEKWNKVGEIIQTTCTELLYREKTTFKGKNQQKYLEIHKLIRKKIREAKEVHLSEKCKDMYKKIKDLTSKKKYNRGTAQLLDREGKLKTETHELLLICREYVEDLFNDTPPETHNVTEEADGLPIITSEIEKAISSMKDNKTPGPDGVHVEILKIMCEADPRFLDILTKLFNNIYETGAIPETS